MKPFNLSASAKYRWMVFSRCFLAVVIGFFIANLSVPLVALWFDDLKALATYSGLLLSFTLWLLVIIYVFSVKSAIKAWLVITGILIAISIIYVLLKIWKA